LPLFLLGLARPVWRWPALAVILLGYWAAFALYPLPAADFDYQSVGVPADWPHLYSGFAAHWNKNSNLAWAFDTWFLNLLPREKAFTHNGGGYATLSFIPTLGTMILGLIAGDWLRRASASGSSANVVRAARVQTPGSTQPTTEASQAGRLRHDADSSAESASDTSHGRVVGQLMLAGIVCLAAGYAADYFGVCPRVKRIWTPAWTLFSGGWCFLLMAAFYSTLDAVGLRAWAFPLRVIGMNSIAAYCIAHLIGGFIIASWKTHLGQHVFETLGSSFEPLVKGGAVLAVYWLILLWMYRRRIFLRI
jgi:predicted acyltransferase